MSSCQMTLGGVKLTVEDGYDSYTEGAVTMSAGNDVRSVYSKQQKKFICACMYLSHIRGQRMHGTMELAWPRRLERHVS